MKKYALFAGSRFYPLGAARDFKTFGDTMEELQDLYAKNKETWTAVEPTWGDIVLVETMETILFTEDGEPWDAYVKELEDE